MMHLIPSTYLAAVGLVLGSAVVAVVGLLISRKLLHIDKLVASHEVGGYLLSVVGTLYAVLLGLIVVDAMQQYQVARQITETEANCLVDVYLMAKQLPAERSKEVREMCTDYASRVVDVEWELQAEGDYCPVARSKAIGLMEKLVDFEPRTENEKALYPQMVQEAGQFWQARQARINMAAKGVPVIEWITLGLGAAITVFFTYFFGMENLKLQVIMTAMVAMLISLNMTLLLLFAYPFSGDMAIHTDSYKQLQSIFEEEQ